MRFALTAIAAVAGFLWWFSWHSNSTALASSGFLGTWRRSAPASSRSSRLPSPIARWRIGKDPKYGDSYARIVSSTLVAERWAQTATLSYSGKITWSSGEVWVRCASASTAAVSTALERLRIQSYIVRD